MKCSDVIESLEKKKPGSIVYYVLDKDYTNDTDYELLCSKLNVSSIDESGGFTYLNEYGIIKIYIFTDSTKFEFLKNLSVEFTVELTEASEISLNSRFSFEKENSSSQILVDWGKGEIKKYDNPDDLYYNYLEPGTYKIRVSNVNINGGKGIGDFSGDKFSIALKEIKFVSKQFIKDFRGFFKQFVNLTKISGTIFLTKQYDYPGVAQCFYGSNKINDLSCFVIDARNTTDKISNLAYAFQHSSFTDTLLNQLTLVGWDKSLVTKAVKAFSSCDISVPTNKFIGNKLVNGFATYIDSKVKFIPKDFFSELEKGSMMFAYCHDLTDVEEGIELPKLKYGAYMFAECPLSYESIERLYNGLPKLAKEAIAHDPGTYYSESEDGGANNAEYNITFGYKEGDEEKIKTLMGIESIPVVGQDIPVTANNNWAVCFACFTSPEQ